MKTPFMPAIRPRLSRERTQTGESCVRPEAHLPKCEGARFQAELLAASTRGHRNPLPEVLPRPNRLVRYRRGQQAESGRRIGLYPNPIEPAGCGAMRNTKAAVPVFRVRSPLLKDSRSTRPPGMAAERLRK